ncbi:dachshund homolog 2-like isoform X1, partial [Lates japonicus]
MPSVVRPFLCESERCSRPGRPPKRTLGVATMTDGSRLLPHSLLSPALLSQT